MVSAVLQITWSKLQQLVKSFNLLCDKGNVMQSAFAGLRPICERFHLYFSVIYWF